MFYDILFHTILISFLLLRCLLFTMLPRYFADFFADDVRSIKMIVYFCHYFLLFISSPPRCALLRGFFIHLLIFRAATISFYFADFQDDMLIILFIICSFLFLFVIFLLHMIFSCYFYFHTFYDAMTSSFIFFISFCLFMRFSSLIFFF